MKSNRTTALLMLLVFLLVVAVVIIFLTGLDRPSRSDNPYENVTVSAAPTEAAATPEPTPSPTPTAAPTSSVPVYYPPSTTSPSQTAQPVTTAIPSVNGSTNTGASAASATAAPTATPVPGADSSMLPAQDLIPIVPGVNDSTSEGAADSNTSSAANLIPVGTSIGSGTFRSDSGTSINIHADWDAVVSGAGTVEITVTAYVDSYSLFTTASPETLNIAVDGQYVSLASPAIEIQSNAGQVTTLINNRTFTISLSGGEQRSIPIEVVWNYRGTYGGTYLETIECGGNITLSR